jgi:hypothetical protein
MKKIIITVVLIFCSFNLFAALNVSVGISKQEANIGDKITVDVKAVTKTQEEVSFNLSLKDDDSFEVSKPEKTVEKLPDGYKLYKLSFNLFPFKLEEITPGEVVITQGDEKVKREIPKIKVVSVFNQDKKKDEINPLKGQMNIKPDYSHLYKYGAYILFALFLFVLLYFIIGKLIRKYKNKEEKEEEVILDPPCVEVKALLSSLLSSNLLKEGKVKEFFVELTETGKRFLGRTFDFDYQFLTTEETFYLIKNHINIGEEKVIREFFDMCDLVKFAKVIPTQGEINATVNLAYKFVELICERLEKEEEKNVQV